MTVRREAFLLHYAVGRAVLTIANHAVNASACWPLLTCPEGHSRAASTCVIGEHRRPHALLIRRVAVDRAVEAPMNSSPRRMPIRGVGADRTDDCTQNSAARRSGQSPIDRFLAPHTTGHHVIAIDELGARRRQGPKAARTRGRSEAKSLARCRAQREHRMRDGRRPAASSHLRSQARSHMVTKRAPREDHLFRMIALCNAARMVRSW